MLYWLIPLIIIALFLIISFVCFYLVFYSKSRKPHKSDEYPIPPGEEYKPYRDQLIKWIDNYRNSDCVNVEIKSHDGLTLRGKYFEYSPDAPIEILFNGYRGSAERDMSGGIDRCARIGHSALVVDQRACGYSDGHIITFGAKESRDCLLWIDYVINNINKDVKIILTGISMGASTVMIAAGGKLPPNVIGILADCGFTSMKAIITKVIRDIKLPPALLWPFIYIGARLFGGFKPDSPSSIEAMKKCRLPIIFFHGETDGFVPAYMSQENYDACTSEYKRIVTIKGAEHGLAFPTDMDKYVSEARAFFEPIEK